MMEEEYTHTLAGTARAPLSNVIAMRTHTPSLLGSVLISFLHPKKKFNGETMKGTNYCARKIARRTERRAPHLTQISHRGKVLCTLHNKVQYSWAGEADGRGAPGRLWEKQAKTSEQTYAPPPPLRPPSPQRRTGESATDPRAPALPQ